MGDMDYGMSAMLWNGLFLASGALAAIFARSHFNWRWLLLALALFNLNIALVLDLFGFNALLYGLAGNPATNFNWAGKIVALAASLILLATPLIERQAAGVTLGQSTSWKIGWAVFALFCLIDVGIALALDTPAFDADAIAYQLTMPSLDEEIFYRGILLYCLVRAFGEGPRFLAANFGWAAAIVTILFGAIHSLFWTNGGIFFSPEIFLFAGGLGALLMWLRLSTGSVLAPILLHSVINTAWLVI